MKFDNGAQPAKAWWQSKTIWVNVIGFIGVIASGLGGGEMSPLTAEFAIGVLTAINVALRFITSKPIRERERKR